MGEASQEHSPVDSGCAFVPPDSSGWACPSSAAPDEWCEHGLASLYRADVPEADAHKKLKHAAVARAALTYNSSNTFYISEESTYVIHFMELQQCKYTGVHMCVSSRHEAHWNLLFHNYIIAFQLLIRSELLDSNKVPGDTVSGSMTQCQQGLQKSPWAWELKDWKSIVSVTCTRS